MNKIEVDVETLKIDNLESILDIKHDNIKLVVSGKNKIILNYTKANIEIFLENDSFLEISSFCKEKKGKTNIIINQSNNTNILFKESFVSNKTSEFNIKNIINGNNNKSEIKVRSISKKGKILIDVDAVVLKGTSDNELIEDVKGINYGGEVEVKPVMEISTSEIVANHFVTIGILREEDLFYLESKGLSKESSEKLLLDGFLKSIIIEEYKDMEVIS